MEEERQAAEADRAPGGVTRRTLLGWGGGWTLAAVGGGAAWGLASCGGGGSGGTTAGGNPAPAAVTGPDPVVLDRPATATLSIQARQVEWVVGKQPAQANAWVFVADASMPGAGVLGSAHGPSFEMRRGTACTVTPRSPRYAVAKARVL